MRFDLKMTAIYPIEVNPGVEFILPKQKLVLVKSPGPLLSRIPELFAEEETMDFRQEYISNESKANFFFKRVFPSALQISL